MTTALVYDERFYDHRTGPHHPERPQRLAAIWCGLRQEGLWERLVHLPCREASITAIGRVHDPAYLKGIEEACAAGRAYLDAGDTTVCPASFQIARLAAGGVLAVIDAVMAGQVDKGFCAVRPPGHHAERDRAMGFCLLNHVAIGACELLERHGCDRVAIVDFDVHHGNGTQHIFEDRAEVLFISLHEDPASLYPGTGRADERGRGAGEGATVNLPLAPGSGDSHYRRAFVDGVLPALGRFGPEVLLVSAGFDASAADPLAHMKVTPAGFAWMSRQLKDAAARWCGGRLISLLEGGYDLDSLGQCVAAHVRVLLDG